MKEEEQQNMYKKLKTHKIKTAIIVVFFLFFNSLPVFAADGTKTEAGAAGKVAISANLPENQINKDQSYFDLLMKPGAEQEVEVTLRNNSDEAITMIGEVNPAVTNDNGVVDYSFHEGEFDETLKYPVSEIATMAKETVIPAKSTENVKIKIKMPEEEIKGVLAGGVYFKEKEVENAKDDVDTGVQIKNKFVYVIGLQMRQTEDIKDLTPELTLDPGKIKASQVNYRNVVGINLQNTEPVYIRDLMVEAKIYTKNGSEVLHESKSEDLKMAPNSNFNYGVSWENQEFKSGTYLAKVTAHSVDYDKSWTWDEEFTITNDEAKKLNEEAVELEKAPTPWWVYVAITVGLILLLLLLIYLVKKQLDKKKALKSENRQKNNRNKHNLKSKSSSSSRKKSKRSSKKNK